MKKKRDLSNDSSFNTQHEYPGFKELYNFNVKNSKGWKTNLIISLAPEYGDSPLKLGDTFETVMGAAADFYPSRFPHIFKFKMNAEENTGLIKYIDNEMWWELDGMKGLAINSWQVKVLQEIEKSCEG